MEPLEENRNFPVSEMSFLLVFYLYFVFLPGYCCRDWLPIGSSLDWSWTLVAVRLASTATHRHMHTVM